MVFPIALVPPVSMQCDNAWGSSSLAACPTGGILRFFEANGREAMSSRMTLNQGDVLIVVHVQNDFVRGGALAVEEGGEVIGPLNRYIEAFNRNQLPIIATRDWHPLNHCSFREQGGPWPPHCVQGTFGAEFVPELMLPPGATVVSSATRADKEAYSSFEDTQLNQCLKNMEARRLFVGGLATDYCVRATVKDGLVLGYEVFLLIDAIRAVNLHPEDGADAQAEMVRHGALPIRLDNIL